MTLEHPFFVILNIIGTFTFAASGVVVAISKGYDLLGIAVLAFATAIGGGTIRDLLIGATPVAWMSDPATIITIFVAIVVSCLFLPHIARLGWLNILFDSAGLAVFTLVGIQKGLDHGLSVLICIILGTMTGSGGGVIRDIFSGERPMLFQKELYASACIGGGLFYFLLRTTGTFSDLWQAVASIIFIVAMRLVAVHYNLSLPTFKRHTRTVRLQAAVNKNRNSTPKNRGK